MSASKQKRARQEQREAYMTEKQRAEAKEAKKLKIYTASFWVVLALCVSIVLGTFAVAPVSNLIYKNTIAVTVGDHELSAAEFNYFYIDAINNYYEEYSSYISYMLDLKSPLSSQTYDKETGKTWADAFIDMAVTNVKNAYSLYDEAMKNNHKLTEEEEASIETVFSNMRTTAKLYYGLSLNEYLVSVYGYGADEDSYLEYYTNNAIASSYLTAYSDSLEYDADALRAYEKDKMHNYNSYTYASYTVNYTAFLETKKDENGKTIANTAEEIAAAREAAKTAAEFLINGTYKDLDEFDKAIQSLKTVVPNSSAKCTRNEDMLYTSINNKFQNWLIGLVEDEEEEKKDDAKTGDAEAEDKEEEKDPVYKERKEGDLTMIPITTTEDGKQVTNGYYVLRFGSMTDNNYIMKNVRHILISSRTYNSSTGTYTYTDAQKKVDKAEAEALLKQFTEGTVSEDAFAALAEKESTDAGSNTNGGLYENIYHGLMVDAFEDWCYDPARKAGDTGLVETEYGWHIMYFVSDSETTYRDFMITNNIRNEDVTKLQEDLSKAIAFEPVNTKYVNRDLILSAQ